VPTDGRGNTTTWVCDTEERATTKTDAIGTAILSYAHDANNRLNNKVDGVGTNGYTHEAVGQILAEDGPWSDDAVSCGYSSRLGPSQAILNPVAGAWVQTLREERGQAPDEWGFGCRAICLGLRRHANVLKNV
jgi:hypothetical protein